jgi:hypothetical protein
VSILPLTEMNEVPEASGSTAATTSVSDFVEPPPSYNSLWYLIFRIVVFLTLHFIIYKSSEKSKLVCMINF